MTRKTFCFICAAVVASWVILLVLMWLGYNVDKLVIAILMGMSIGAIATKYIFTFVLKTSFVVFGLLLVWLLLNDKVGYSLFAFMALVLTYSLQYKLNPKRGEQPVNRFKDCC